MKHEQCQPLSFSFNVSIESLNINWKSFMGTIKTYGLTATFFKNNNQAEWRGLNVLVGAFLFVCDGKQQVCKWMSYDLSFLNNISIDDGKTNIIERFKQLCNIALGIYEARI